ncbi:TIR domain-containing protein [Actinoplanes sp. TRM 88003]|uniref:TIR domain-containing protein n=1 Tax=Paractinoplanes aksuensis TaxID=2939490 RepID=A0ABT1DKK4_9ACTN|nr:TIR domain-containing protein [Actinoplanes aksuensis]MCO8271033.1 TIR domain-containing protein [Actinoplanes aksuensis]
MLPSSPRPRSSSDRGAGPVPARPEGNGRAEERDHRYDAFLSYSRDASQDLATRLQRWLERFATPWYRPRSLRIFRDYTSLAASDSLSQGLRDAIADSRNFILLASPQAAASKWVDQEVRWWAENRSSANFYIVLASGSLVWRDEDADWDWKRTDALPPSAGALFEREPLWVDLSQAEPHREPDNALLNLVAQVAAPLRGADKDTLFGEHLDLHRRAQRQRRGAVFTLVVLLVAALIATVAAVGQTRIARNERDTAQQERDTAVSRLLSLKSQDLARSDPQTAARLLIAANRLGGRNDQTRVALANLMLNSPWAATAAAHDTAVSAIAVRPDGTTVTSLGQDRTITSWNGISPPARSALPGPGSLDTAVMALAPNALAAATIDGRSTTGANEVTSTYAGLEPINVWDLDDGTATGRSTIVPLIRNEGFAPVLAFSPDARRLAVGEGRTVSIWALPREGEPTLEGRLQAPKMPDSASSGVAAEARALVFSPDGSRLAFLSDGNLSLWNVPGRTLLDSIINVPLHPPLQFSSDGRLLAVGGEGTRGSTISVAVSDRGRLEADWDHAIELAGAVAFRPNSKSLALGDNRGRIRRWPESAETWPGAIVQDMSAGSSSVTALNYLPDGRLVSGSADGEVTLWETPGGRYRPTRVPTPAPGGKKPDRVVFSAELTTMATTTGDWTTFWNVAGRRPPRKINTVRGINPVFLTERRVFTTTPTVDGTTAGQVLLSEISDVGRPRSTALPMWGYPAPIGDTGLLLVNSAGADEADSTAQIWRLPIGELPSALVAELPAYADVLNDRLVLSHGEDPKLWDLPSRPGADVRPHPYDLPEDSDVVSWHSPDGRAVVVGYFDDDLGPTELWDLADPARVMVSATLPGTIDRGLWSATFSQDSKLLVTGLGVGSLALWDLADPRHPVKLSETTSQTDGEGRLREIGPPLVLSPDGRSLVSGEDDGVMTLWDVSDPRSPARVTTFPVPYGEVPEVRFSPDGDVVVLGEALWRIEDLNRLRAGALEQACTRTGGGLTEAEWQLYAPGIAYRETC